MEMFNRESGVNEPIGTRTIEELKKYRLRIFNLMIYIYSITQKDNKNNWLFECKKHKVLPYPKAWRSIFLQSINTDVDFDKRWLGMPPISDTDVASTSSKNRNTDVASTSDKKGPSQVDIIYLRNAITKVGTNNSGRIS